MTSYRDVVARTWEEDRLFSVLVELTYRCNLDCAFCYNDLSLTGAPLTSEEYLRFFDDLRGMRVLNLVLSGGEPLAHPDFFALGRAARARGFVVRVKTNGHALRGALACRLRDEVDPFLVELSLHGATAETHDRQTRVAGSFERLTSNLRAARAAGLRMKLNATLTAWNEGEIEAMFALADDLGLPLQFDPEVTPKDDGDRTPLALTASRAGVRRLFEIEFARGAARAARVPALPRQADELLPAPPRKHCGAGSSGIAVDPYGNVYPCVQWRVPAGNLHERSIREIWKASPSLERVRAQTAEVKDKLAAVGPQAALMNFCPGLAASLSGGDPLVIYPGARKRAALIAELMAERATTE